MMRFPFNHPRPMPPHMYRQQQMRRNQQAEKKISYEDLFKNASLSPELSFLLAMTLKDGVSQSKVFDMLKSIEPYVSGSDKNAIHSILGARKMTDNFMHETPNFVPEHGEYGEHGLSGFSKLSRQQALLGVLQKYASKETSGMMRNLQQSVQMQENFARMSKRMEKLRNMNNASPEDMFEAISMFMPPEEQSKFRNMQNMMRMMGSMKNFKPEDMFKFMSNNR